MTTAEREKFVRLVNKRVNVALKAIQQVGKLSNRSSYDYEKEDVEMIFKSLQKEIDDCRKRFEIAMNVDSWVQFKIEE